VWHNNVKYVTHAFPWQLNDPTLEQTMYKKGFNEQSLQSLQLAIWIHYINQSAW
jgi:hypothetical protein